jgi:hypothetical protein
VTSVQIKHVPVRHTLIATAEQARNVYANYRARGQYPSINPIRELSDGRTEFELTLWQTVESIPAAPTVTERGLAYFLATRRRALYLSAVAAGGALFIVAALLMLSGHVVETLTTERGLVVGTLAIVGGVFLSMSVSTAKNGEKS